MRTQRTDRPYASEKCLPMTSPHTFCSTVNTGRPGRLGGDPLEALRYDVVTACDNRVVGRCLLDALRGCATASKNDPATPALRAASYTLYAPMMLLERWASQTSPPKKAAKCTTTSMPSKAGWIASRFEMSARTHSTPLTVRRFSALSLYPPISSSVCRGYRLSSRSYRL